MKKEKKHKCDNPNCREELSPKEVKGFHDMVDEIVEKKQGFIILLRVKPYDKDHSELDAKIVGRQFDPLHIIKALLEAKILSPKKILKFLIMEDESLVRELATIAHLASAVEGLGMKVPTYIKQHRHNVHTTPVCKDKNCTSCNKK